MNPIELLRQEHRDIQRVLDLVARAVEEGRNGGRVNAAFFQRAAEFFRRHVEANHHLKEHVLHRALRDAGFSSQHGLLGQLADEHAFGREATEELGRRAEALMRGELDAEAVLSSAQSYLRMHRLHTELEERELLPVAQRLLAPHALERIWSRFARIEERGGALAEAAHALELAFGIEARR